MGLGNIPQIRLTTLGCYRLEQADLQGGADNRPDDFYSQSPPCRTLQNMNHGYRPYDRLRVVWLHVGWMVLGKK
ncbi:hypothetical protein ACTXT7_006759 [Hymenolepis weldensis]